MTATSSSRATYSLLLNYAYAGLLAVSFLCMSASGMLAHEDHIWLRFIVTAAGLFGVYAATKTRKTAWAVLQGALAVVFNPVWHPHGLERETWMGLDLLAIGVILASVFYGMKPGFGKEAKPAA